jgi:hypothetical protein
MRAATTSQDISSAHCILYSGGSVSADMADIMCVLYFFFINWESGKASIHMRLSQNAKNLNFFNIIFLYY